MSHKPIPTPVSADSVSFSHSLILFLDLFLFVSVFLSVSLTDSLCLSFCLSQNAACNFTESQKAITALSSRRSHAWKIELLQNVSNPYSFI